MLKNKFSFVIILLSILLFYTTIAYAAPIVEREESPVFIPQVTLADCLLIALAKNYSIQQSKESLIQAEVEYYNLINEKLMLRLGGKTSAGAVSDRSGFHDFDITGSLNYNAPSGDSIKAEVINNQNFLYPFIGHSATAEYRHPLAKGQGEIVAWQDIRSAKRNWTLEEVNYFLSKQELSSSVINLYFRLILNKELINVNEVFVKSSKENLEMTRKKFNEGLIPKLDLTRAEGSVLGSELALLNSKKNWNDTKDRLMTMLGLDPRTEIEPIPEIPASILLFKEDLCIEAALRDRKELLTDEINIEKIKDALVIAKNNKKPQIDFVARWDNTKIGTSSSSDVRNSYTTWTAMLEYSMDINRKRLDTDISQAQREGVLSYEKLEERKRVVTREIRECLRELDIAQSRIINQEENLNAAKERLHLATRSWEEGIIENREMIDAQQDLVSAQSSYVQAKIEKILAEYELKRVMGEDLAELVIRLKEVNEK